MPVPTAKRRKCLMFLVFFLIDQRPVIIIVNKVAIAPISLIIAGTHLVKLLFSILLKSKAYKLPAKTEPTLNANKPIVMTTSGIDSFVSRIFDLLVTTSSVGRGTDTTLTLAVYPGPLERMVIT